MLHLVLFVFSYRFLLVEAVPILVFASKTVRNEQHLERVHLWRFCLFLALHRGHHPYREEGQTENCPENQ